MYNLSNNMKKLLLILLIFVGVSCQQRRQVILSDEVPPVESEREAKILSGFFGLDNAIPPRAAAISPKAPGKDGMPIVFSHELDPETMQASDFRVKTSQGDLIVVEIATFTPAIEAFELRTVLLIGDLGDAPGNVPVEVEIISDLLARSGQNFKGQKVLITPLEKGPFLSYAEHFVMDEAYPYIEKGSGCDCPRQETTTVLKAVWSGGVRATNGDELGDAELKNFVVFLKTESDTMQVTPFKIADIDDGDNNVDLCIKEPGTPIFLTVQANTAMDPRDDPNEYTELEVKSRW